MRIKHILLSLLVSILFFGASAQRSKTPPRERVEKPAKGKSQSAATGKGAKGKGAKEDAPVKDKSLPSPSKSLKLADEAFDLGEYYTASVHYRNALKADSSRVDVAYKYAEASRLNNDFKPAERWYKFVTSKDKGPELAFPYASFWLGETYKSLGKYNEAKKLYKSYFSKYGRKEFKERDTNYYASKSKFESTVACDQALKLNGIPNSNVFVWHMDELINSEYDDYAPYQLDDTILYYSSAKTDYKMPKGPKAKDSVTVQLSKIYKTYRKDSLWLFTAVLKSFYNVPNMNNSHGVFSTDHRRFYFVRSKPVLRSQFPLDELYMTQQDAEGRWMAAIKLPSPINLSGTTNSDPAVYSINRDEDVIIWTSDREGSGDVEGKTKGGLDLWSCRYNARTGATYDYKNLGKRINSPDDEVSPFITSDGKTLYFSSKWHGSLGGFDIFMSTKSGNEWSAPVNLGYPINTSYDDKYFTLTSNGADGYFSSNRTGTISKKGPNCCLDIHYFKFLDQKQRLDSLRQIQRAAAKASGELKTFQPIKLFFEEKAPESASNDSTTRLEYEATAREYLDHKPLYVKNLTKNVAPAKKGNVISDLENFFSNRVASSIDELEKLCYQMEQGLILGREIKITIKAFAPSPQAINLAKRRINTVAKYLGEYNYKAFEPYLTGNSLSGGKLTVYRSVVVATPTKDKKGKMISTWPADFTNPEPNLPNIPTSMRNNYILITDLHTTEPKVKIK